MTKKTLLNKILNKAKKAAVTTALIAAPFIYSNNVNAQTTGGVQSDKGLIDASGLIGGKLSEFQTLNADSVPTYVKGSSNIEDALFIPSFLTIDIGNKHYAAGVFTAKKLEMDGKEADALDVHLELKEKYSDLMKIPEGETMIPQIVPSDFSENLHKIKIGGVDYAFFAISQEMDTAKTYNPDWKSLVDEVKEGKVLGLLVPSSKLEIGRDNKANDDFVSYSIISANEIYAIKYNEELSPVQDIANKRERLNEEKRKFLVDDKFGNEFSLIERNSIIRANHAYDLPFLDAEEEVEEKQSNVDGRIKAGIAYMTPNGFNVSINPQLKVSDNSYLGVNAFYSNPTKSLENITQEEPLKIVANWTAEIYYVNTGQKVNENTTTTNNFGLGLNFSYVGPNYEINLEAGKLGQKSEKIMNSESKEYTEIAGEIDPSSVIEYNESNTTQTNNNLFKGPAYFSVGGEFFPLKGKDKGLLENISVAGDVGYVTGDNSGAFGKLGIKYTLGKKESKKE